MHIGSTELLKLKIKKNLSRIPDDKLEEISNFIVFLLHKSDSKEPEPVQLSGIWKHSGFDKIDNLESALEKARIE